MTLTAAACSSADLAAERAAAAVTPPPAGAAKLPDVALVDEGGAPVRVDQLAAGKPALVTFWASWCDACAAEVEALNRLHDRAQASAAVVIGVDVGEPRDRGLSFAREHGIRYPQVFDEEMALAGALGQRRLPATIVLDRRGRVVFTGGALDAEALAAFRGVLRGVIE